MFEDSITYPLRGSWLKRTVIGGLLVFPGALLILPAVVVFGYYIRTLRESVAGIDDPPELADWGGLFVDGLKGIVVALVYAGVPMVLWFVAVIGFAGTGALVGGEEGAAIAGALSLVGLLLIFPLALLISYLLPAALTNFAAEDSIGAAFDFGRLKHVYLSADYVIAILLAFLVTVALNVVTSILTFTVVGVVLVPFVVFYANVVMHRLYAHGYLEATRESALRTSASRTSVH